jgi:hypothetical protein
MCKFIGWDIDSARDPVAVVAFGGDNIANVRFWMMLAVPFDQIGKPDVQVHVSAAAWTSSRGHRETSHAQRTAQPVAAVGPLAEVIDQSPVYVYESFPRDAAMPEPRRRHTAAGPRWAAHRWRVGCE